ncbi:MAG: hypothetical protein II171_02620 [Bacteroidales bacterium]|nr:hypothetical protein [Bacteroidales bacterium]
MMNALPNMILDFKKTNGSFAVLYTSVEGNYRGMPIWQGNTPIISSAREIGNLAAGYVAGIRKIPWKLARRAYDALEFFQTKGKNKTEGMSTQNAQFYGWKAGYQQNKR